MEICSQISPLDDLGIILGSWIGMDLPEKAFKIIMAILIFLILAFVVWWDQKKVKTVPTH